MVFIKVANYHRGRVVIVPRSNSAYSEIFTTELKPPTNPIFPQL